MGFRLVRTDTENHREQAQPMVYRQSYTSLFFMFKKQILTLIC